MKQFIRSGGKTLALFADNGFYLAHYEKPEEFIKALEQLEERM